MSPGPVSSGGPAGGPASDPPGAAERPPRPAAGRSVKFEEITAGQGSVGASQQSTGRPLGQVPYTQRSSRASLAGSTDVHVSLDEPLEPKAHDQQSLPPSSSAGEERLSAMQRAKAFVVDDYYVPRDQILAQIMSGVVVGLAVVPEAIAFALVAGISPQTGVDTTLITSIIIGIVGDRPGLCNGASGAIAVVVVELVAKFSVVYMGYTVIFAGLICIAFALLRMSNLVVFISASVMIGFVNGLAIIIGCAQFTGFKVSPSEAAALPEEAPPSRQLLSAFDVFVDGAPWVEPVTAGWMAMEICIVMLTMVGMGYIPWKWVKVIPASLVGILLATAAEWGIVRPAGYSTRTVGDIGEMTGAFPIPLWMRDYSPEELPPLNRETFGIILPYAASLAAVALIEQLMTLELVNVMTKTTASPHRESFGLGVGNVVAGCFGGMGGNAMIGQSVIQVVVLIITLVAYPFVNIIPQAAFIGMMWMIVFYTFEWGTFRLVWHAFAPMQHREKAGMFQKIKRVDVLVIVTVTVVTIFTNLAIAVGVGVFVNLVAFGWDSQNQVRLTGTDYEEVPDQEAQDQTHTVKVYEIEGPLFFASARKFKALFDVENDPHDVEMHCLNMQVMDYSALEAIGTVATEYAQAGKRLHLRFLKEESHRQLAKGRGMLQDVASWRVARNLDEEEVDLIEANMDHMQLMREAKQKHYSVPGAGKSEQ